MNVWEFYSTHPVGYSILLVILLDVIFEGISNCFKYKYVRRKHSQNANEKNLK